MEPTFGNLSLTFGPTLCVLLRLPIVENGYAVGVIIEHGMYGRIEATYLKMLDWSLAHRWVIVLACAVTPANQPEEEGAAPLAEDIRRQGFTIGEVHVDRAYVNSPLVSSVLSDGGSAFSKPWALRASKPGLFSKADFRIDLRAKTISLWPMYQEYRERSDNYNDVAEAVLSRMAEPANLFIHASGIGR